jgi:predicted DNA-binding transcriptional regulator AlpA
MKEKAMPSTDHMKNYLSITELCERTSYARKSVYNMVSQGIFKEGTHYFKPTQRKLLFFWPAVEAWIRGGTDEQDT